MEVDNAEMIDVYSYIAFLMRTYILISAINALLSFFRIFQFFQFSSKLSSFTEILKDSKSDIIYFMIMFIIIFLGFAVMITIYLGENLESFSDLLSTTNQLLFWIICEYDYFSFSEYSPMSPIFFVAFIVIFSLFLISMLIAIIMAHYYEYEEQQIMLQFSLEGQQHNFFQLMFQFVKKAAAPEEQKSSKWAVVKCWH